MAAYTSISQKRRSNGHAATYRNIFKFFSSVNFIPGPNRNQESRKLGKLISSVLQKTEHFTVMLQMSHKREKKIPNCGRVILLKSSVQCKNIKMPFETQPPFHQGEEKHPASSLSSCGQNGKH